VTRCLTMTHWMVCDCGHYVSAPLKKPCLFDEGAGLRRGDPPRCIRHGALLFSDSTLSGMTREEARRVVRERHEAEERWGTK